MLVLQGAIWRGALILILFRFVCFLHAPDRIVHVRTQHGPACVRLYGPCSILDFCFLEAAISCCAVQLGKFVPTVQYGVVRGRIA